MQLERRIKEAFPLAPIPEAPILCTYDDEDIIPTFLGRPWNDFTVLELRDHSAAINFLTLDAFLYYLPAFLAATLRDRETADIIPDGLLSRFAASDEDAIELVGRLNREQRSVVGDFFSFFVGDDRCYVADVAKARELLECAQP